MRIDVAILDTDKNYIDRLSKYFQLNYSQKISITSFAEEQDFLTAIKDGSYEVAILSNEFININEQIKDNVIVGVFTKDNTVEKIGEISAIGKYQSVNGIYKQILGLYADNSANVVLKSNKFESQIIMFTSGQGGSGTTSLAAAFSINRANEGKKVLYLNMENFNSTDEIFESDGYGSFSDAIYALKNSKVNTSMKLQSLIRTDNNVDYIPGCKNAFDMTEITCEEISMLLDELQSINDYEIIVIDCSDCFSERQIYLMEKHADSIIYVNDGSDIGNCKFRCFCEALRVLEMSKEVSILDKVSHIYNRFSSKTSTQLEEMPVEHLGGISRIEGLHEKALVEMLSKDTHLNSIV